MLFGDNIVESRNKLSEFNSRTYPDFEIVKAGSCDTQMQFDEALQTQSMFENKKLLIFENFFKGRAPKWKTEIDFKNLAESESVYIFWEEEDINIVGKNLSRVLPKTQVFEFKIPNLLWNFLDGIGGADKPARLPARQGGLSLRIKDLNQILKTVDANYLFLMLVRQFRLLLIIKENWRDYPSEYKRLTFQKYKLASQAKNFSLEKLKEAYNNLLSIEERAKTGKGIYSFHTELEKFLINL